MQIPQVSVIHLVRGETGRYDYSLSWIVASYTDAAAAESHRAAAQAEGDRLRKESEYFAEDTNRFDLNCRVVDGYIRYFVEAVPLFAGPLPEGGLFATVNALDAVKTPQPTGPELEGSFANKLRAALGQTAEAV